MLHVHMVVERKCIHIYKLKVKQQRPKYAVNQLDLVNCDLKSQTTTKNRHHSSFQDFFLLLNSL